MISVISEQETLVADYDVVLAAPNGLGHRVRCAGCSKLTLHGVVSIEIPTGLKGDISHRRKSSYEDSPKTKLPRMKELTFLLPPVTKVRFTDLKN